MISTSVKQMIAWTVAFGLSGGFFFGCLAALKHLPSRASSSQPFSLHEEGHAHSSKQSEHAAGSHAED